MTVPITFLETNPNSGLNTFLGFFVIVGLWQLIKLPGAISDEKAAKAYQKKKEEINKKIQENYEKSQKLIWNTYEPLKFTGETASMTFVPLKNDVVDTTTDDEDDDDDEEYYIAKRLEEEEREREEEEERAREEEENLIREQLEEEERNYKAQRDWEDWYWYYGPGSKK